MNKQIYRYMSGKEKNKLMRKKTVQNLTEHAALGRQSTAIGFCFGLGGLEQAKRDFRKLRGIVTPQFLLVGEPFSEFNFRRCVGIYVDWKEFDKLPLEVQTKTPIGAEPHRQDFELCCTEYDLKMFRNYSICEIIDPIPTKGHPTKFKLDYWK